VGDSNGTSQTSEEGVEAAVRYAEANGWRVVLGGSHAWGRIYCPYNNVDCRCGEFCITSVWSTPKNPANHARQIERVVAKCALRQRMDED
jgi:hypothetical protein